MRQVIIGMWRYLKPKISLTENCFITAWCILACFAPSAWFLCCVLLSVNSSEFFVLLNRRLISNFCVRVNIKTVSLTVPFTWVVLVTLHNIFWYNSLLADLMNASETFSPKNRDLKRILVDQVGHIRLLFEIFSLTIKKKHFCFLVSFLEIVQQFKISASI